MMPSSESASAADITGFVEEIDIARRSPTSRDSANGTRRRRAPSPTRVAPVEELADST